MKCKRCLSSWIPRKQGKPVQCPRCKSPYWDRERKNSPMHAAGQVGRTPGRKSGGNGPMGTEGLMVDSKGVKS
jgi:hypothetical protein